MVSEQTVIINPTGLHGRPISNFTQLAKRFECNIKILPLGRKFAVAVDAKSPLMVLSCDIRVGQAIEIQCEGTDEQEALDALLEFVASGCGE